MKIFVELVYSEFKFRSGFYTTNDIFLKQSNILTQVNRFNYYVIY